MNGCMQIAEHVVHFYLKNERDESNILSKKLVIFNHFIP